MLTVGSSVTADSVSCGLRYASSAARDELRRNTRENDFRSKICHPCPQTFLLPISPAGHVAPLLWDRASGGARPHMSYVTRALTASTPPTPCGVNSASSRRVKRPSGLDLPGLLGRELPNPTVKQAATVRIGAVKQRNAPDFILAVVHA